MKKATIKLLADRHRHAMNYCRPNERGMFARACFYSAYRCARVAEQAGILEPTRDGFYGLAIKALHDRNQEVAHAQRASNRLGGETA